MIDRLYGFADHLWQIRTRFIRRYLYASFRIYQPRQTYHLSFYSRNSKRNWFSQGRH